MNYIILVIILKQHFNEIKLSQCAESLEKLEITTQKRIRWVQIIGTISAIAVPLAFTIQFFVLKSGQLYEQAPSEQLFMQWDRFLIQLTIECGTISILLLITTSYFCRLIRAIFGGTKFKEQMYIMVILSIFFVTLIMRIVLVVIMSKESIENFY